MFLENSYLPAAIILPSCGRGGVSLVPKLGIYSMALYLVVTSPSLV